METTSTFIMVGQTSSELHASNTHNDKTLSMRQRMEHFIRFKQLQITTAISSLDVTPFLTDEWIRPNGGGGHSCVLQDTPVFEKAGVNISVIHGDLSPSAVKEMRANHKALPTDVSTDENDREQSQGLGFHALGLSLVLHPRNPMAPTVHMNCRYLETLSKEGSVDASWFGGGTDLTPSYLFDEDAIHFHSTLKQACDKHDAAYYPRFKSWCDDYFTNKHRDEKRGIGGIFFDDLDADVADPENAFAFVQSVVDSFLPAYLPVVEKRKDMEFTDKQKEWQQVRRGRHVEFNLVHDRGTAFDLNVPGSRVESILISMPLTAQWRYVFEPEPGSQEQVLLDVLKAPRDWV